MLVTEVGYNVDDHFVDNCFKLADGDLSDEAFKHELINSMLMSPSKDKFNHHLNKNYDWMDDYMIWITNSTSNWNINSGIFCPIKLKVTEGMKSEYDISFRVKFF